ncbi:hypothetical protein PG911_11745 [Tenacibaculum ovolyticum]|uniref:tetratricopeptide repeat protein n=1 Tax=Tenacibaculum ovolyticum TaxID=104270 RepID=UPI0022F3A8D0|nr:hypothetical protein [Tenacibaculum ovolyticum]WBX75329.1 hypothetical protein PG911_11745 [Tenacibaculum ovolyticum]
MKQTELVTFVNKISENGVSYAHGKGFEFFQETLLPNIKKAEKSITNKNTLADCWYVIGDIYDFNDSPLKAIESYKKAISFDPKIASAYREIGNMQERIGKYSNAILSIKKALEIEPTDDNTILDLKNAEDSLKKNEKPLYKSSELNWKLSELLANQRFNEVIKLAKNSTNNSVLKKLACAYGGLRQVENYLNVWNQILSSKSDIEIEYSDWFFMPNNIYESEHIWLVFKKMNSKIISSIFIQSDSLNENYKNLKDFQKRELMCDYQIYDNTENKVELNKLSLKYPKWEEVKN